MTKANLNKALQKLIDINKLKVKMERWVQQLPDANSNK